MTALVFWKCLFLFLAIMYGFSNTVKAFRKHSIGNSQLFLMTIGIVGFVWLEFWH